MTESKGQRPVGDGKGTTVNGPLGRAGGCVYLPATPSAGAPSIVNVGLSGTTVTRDQFLAQITAKAPDATDVPDIGEVAKNVGGLLAVFDHGKAIDIQVVVDGTPADMNTLVNLGRTVLNRL